MTAYYNEIDPRAAAWLRELINRSVIAPGVVDETDIRDVRPDQLSGYTQCHFFAGIGVWSYALRLAGWSDDRPVWTGSCPCQPFSAAGKGDGLADERHLWPTWFHLIQQRRPVAIFGEQVSGGDGLAWLDVVRPDLEGAAYSLGCADLCAPGVGAPNLRQRLFFVADADGRYASAERLQRSGEHGQQQEDSRAVCLADADRGGLGKRGARFTAPEDRPTIERDCRLGGLGDANSDPGWWDTRTVSRSQGANEWSPRRSAHGLGDAGVTGELGDAGAPRLSAREFEELFGTRGGEAGRATQQSSGSFWSDAEWIYCRDRKWRPVEPGTFPLVDGAPARLVRLRGYGNSINAEVAAAWIEAYMSVAA